MASSTPNNHSSSSSFTKSQLKLTIEEDDDDFQNPTFHYSFPLTQTPLKPVNRTVHRVSKKQKLSVNYHSPGKENIPPQAITSGFDLDGDYCGLDAIPSTFDEFTSSNRVANWKESDAIEKKGLDLKRKKSCLSNSIESRLLNSEVGGCSNFNEGTFGFFDKKGLELKQKESYLSNSIESRLLNSRVGGCSDFNEGAFVDFEPDTQFDLLFKLCAENEVEVGGDCVVLCPLCETDISGMTEELRQVHTNNCLDQGEVHTAVLHNAEPGLEISREVAATSPIRLPGEVVDISPVLDWLDNLGLEKYEDCFIREEVDWDTLQWLSEEDLINIGITALGPRKKIVHALNDLRRGTHQVEVTRESVHSISDKHRGKNLNRGETLANTSKVAADDIGNSTSNKLITDFFPGSGVADKNKVHTRNDPMSVSDQCPSEACPKRGVKRSATTRKARDIPLWCCVLGTPFRVDAFKFLRRDCSHWFLTHFHIDHYQGLTKSFSHGTIYCSLITAKLVNLKIGIPWDKLQVLPLDQKVNIAGINVTCFDANHCPGSIMILFEPPNDKAILHTGDFRFSETMSSLSVLQSHPIHSLILDTTYCNPQYDFPKQEDVIQFVIEAIQAEAFNPKTLFLIGSYTIGKERLFLEVARVLRKKVYVNASKLRLLKCLGFPEEDMQWFTLNELESHIHVVPMWTLASFKRLKHVSNQYAGRYNLIVAFSPTGWTFGKGKKKCPGRRWQQGTLIRYEVPYSEHSSFTELREFVKKLSPANIIPSVNNEGPESANNMVALLTS